MNLAYYAEAINQDSLKFDVGIICISQELEINGFHQRTNENPNLKRSRACLIRGMCVAPNPAEATIDISRLQQILGYSRNRAPKHSKGLHVEANEHLVHLLWHGLSTV